MAILELTRRRGWPLKEKSKLDELLDELMQDKTPEEIVSDSGVLGVLTKRLYERHGCYHSCNRARVIGLV